MERRRGGGEERDRRERAEKSSHCFGKGTTEKGEGETERKKVKEEEKKG